MIKIDLFDVLGNNIFTRKVIAEFFKELNRKNDIKILVDFSGVDFISRSCADEYIKQKEQSAKKITEANMPENICSMFNVVKNQYKKAVVVISFDFCNADKRLIPA